MSLDQRCVMLVVDGITLHGKGGTHSLTQQRKAIKHFLPICTYTDNHKQIRQWLTAKKKKCY
jgi:hypothetical protein